MTITTEPPVTANTGRLLERARQGEGEAFCQLAATHETKLYRQAVGLCGDLDTAEDLVAETMVEAWRSLGRFDGACRFSTWLYAILLHRYQKLVRRGHSRPVPLASWPGRPEGGPEAVLAQLPDPGPTALQELLQAEVAATCGAALAALPSAHQDVILLRFYEGASLAEMAAALEVPLGTVKSRLHHALARLRDMPMVVNLFNSERDT